MNVNPDISRGPSAVRVVRAAASETDGYERNVSGISIQAIRTGAGHGANRVSVVGDSAITATSCDLGFPIMTRTTVGADRYIIAAILSAVGSRWCGIDLHDASVLAYGPSAEHTGVNNEGLRFAFTVASAEVLDERAQVLGVRVALPQAGEVQGLDAQRNLDVLRGLVLGLDDASSSPNVGLNTDEVLSAMVFAFGLPIEQFRASSSRTRLDDRAIVHRCLDLAVALGRRPTLSELCVASCVSERRLRQAFVSQFDVPPAQFFRLWALTEARRRLSAADSGDRLVTATGLDLGFGHLGRFAQYYRAVYGETPSETVRSGRFRPGN